jgi:hypothetical protein
VRRLALLLPPVRSIVEQRDSFFQRMQRLDADNVERRAEALQLAEDKSRLVSAIASLSRDKNALFEQLVRKTSIATGLLTDRDQKIALLHIPKTGGTSLSNWLYEVFQPGEILTDFRACQTNALGHFLKSDLESFIRNLAPEELRRCKIFSGHLPFGFEASLNLRFTYVSFLRSPVDRLLSGFLYANSVTPGLQEDYLLCGLHRSISNCASPGFDNPLTRILTGSELLVPASPVTAVWDIPPVTDEDRQVAIRSLMTRFGFVGLIEHFDDSCRILFSLLGKKYEQKKSRLNETTLSLNGTAIPQSTLRLLERHLVHDIAVYAAGCEIYNEHARIHGFKNAVPYIRRTSDEGAISSGDHAHVVSAADAFTSKSDGLWLSRPEFKDKRGEYVGYDFGKYHKCTAIEIQMANLQAPRHCLFSVEASNDNFIRDIRCVAEVSMLADNRRQRIVLPGHDIVAKSWRLLRLPDDDGEHLAVAFISFDPFIDAPVRDMDRVLSRLREVRRVYC